MFHLCYLDESGCLGALPSSNSAIQPVFAIVGLIVPAGYLARMTRDFMAIKRRYNPRGFSSSHYLDSILTEVKGKSLRRDLRAKTKSQARAALRFLSDILQLLEAHPQVRLVGRIWVKPVGQAFKGREVYTSSVQSLAAYFEEFLFGCNSQGIMACDSRSHHLNSQVAHSIFTQKFGRQQPQLAHLQDLPFFADSRNHAGIQLADIVCSSIIAPLAATVYCSKSMPTSNFVDSKYLALRSHFGRRLQRLQHRFVGSNGQWTGGLVVSDPNGQSGGHLFR